MLLAQVGVREIKKADVTSAGRSVGLKQAGVTCAGRSVGT